MGFPLHRGTVSDGILTCHWHHARFDLCSGGTFDQWADDLRRFPAEMRDDDVLVDPRPPADPAAHQRRRLQVGLERDIPLVLAKAAIALWPPCARPAWTPFRAGLDSASGAARGWGRGPHDPRLHDQPAPRLDAGPAASRSTTASPMWPTTPPARRRASRLSRSRPRAPGRTSWRAGFAGSSRCGTREGAERALVSAVRARRRRPAGSPTILFAACTDHRYLEPGHVLDFTNKALEALDHAGWEHAEPVSPACRRRFASAAPHGGEQRLAKPGRPGRRCSRTPSPALPTRWRRRRRRRLERPRGAGRRCSGTTRPPLRRPAGGAGRGATAVELAAAVAFAAALRIARFQMSNEFGDWDTALHTFTFANAIHQGLRRAPSPELLRGCLRRRRQRLPRPLPQRAGRAPAEPRPAADPEALLAELPELLDRQQQVNEAGELVADYLAAGGDAERCVAALGPALVREDRNFHTIQCLEAASRQQRCCRRRRCDAAADRGRPLPGGHATTTRAQRQTFEIARRLHRGENLFEEDEVA